jgi:hypothetical protein
MDAQNELNNARVRRGEHKMAAETACKERDRLYSLGSSAVAELDRLSDVDVIWAESAHSAAYGAVFHEGQVQALASLLGESIEVEVDEMWLCRVQEHLGQGLDADHWYSWQD